MGEQRMLKMAVLLSGSGSTLENFFEKIEQGELDARVVVVVSSLSSAFGIERAKRRGVPAYVLPRRKYADVAEYTAAIFAKVREHGAQMVALAGFMVQIGVPADFRGRIMNVHPALIPAFCGKGIYGHHAHEAVLKAGVKLTGCTVHFVDEEYDHGPIVMQQAVEVCDDDTPDSLAERVQAAERDCYPKAIQLFADGRLEIEGKRVRVRPATPHGNG
jgi:formyltetrahydrofolate-dependent phosphoribosylglycinamide formyltransferase